MNKLLRIISLLGLIGSAGCGLLPQIAHEPTLHNPFPQLSKVAVAPFFNLSHEPTLDGRKVAFAYFNELQLVPGFEVVPVGVVEQAMHEHRLSLCSAAEARLLAQILDVDAVVIGAVTDYSPYYPPRLSLQVEWFAANPGFHPIPPGYGLPWGTSGERDIPGPLVFESQMALARAQLKTQTPPFTKTVVDPPLANAAAADGAKRADGNGLGQQLSYQFSEGAKTADPAGRAPASGLPADWPDPHGFTPPPPQKLPPTCWPSDEPVLRHTRTYNGHDAEFTDALNSYYFTRNDVRLGGSEGYLQRSDDFLRFCCHMHLWEMLSARGGAGESRVVWHWPCVR
ncbi:MAG: hypothetical protein ABSG68_01460 [Thermoguttaceae bacterium]